MVGSSHYRQDYYNGVCWKKCLLERDTDRIVFSTLCLINGMIRNLITKIPHQLKNRLLKNGHLNWALLDQAMVSAVNFTTGLLLVRFLGIAEFGYFTLVWMVVLFLSSIQTALITAPMMSIAPKQNTCDKASYYGDVMIKQVYFSSLSFILVIVLGNSLHYFFPAFELSDLVLPLAFVVVTVQFQDFIRRLLFSQGKAKRGFINDAVRYLGQIFLLIYIFFTSNMDTVYVLWIISLMSAIAVVMAAGELKSFELRSVFPFDVARRHWVSSKWMLLSALLQWLSGNLFFILTGAILGTVAVGALKAAQNLLAVLHIIFQGLENVVPNNASLRLHQYGFSSMVQYLKKVALISSVVTTVFALIMGISAEFWLNIVFGQHFVEYSYLVQSWAAIYVLMSLLLPLRVAYRAMEKTKNIFISYSLAALFAISSGWFLVQQFSLVGSMLGLFINYMIMAIFLAVSLKKIKNKLTLNDAN